MTNLFSKQAQREQGGLCKPRGEERLNHSVGLWEASSREQLGMPSHGAALRAAPACGGHSPGAGQGQQGPPTSPPTLSPCGAVEPGRAGVQAACRGGVKQAAQAGVGHQCSETHMQSPGSCGCRRVGAPILVISALQGSHRLGRPGKEAQEFALAGIGHPLICCY